MSIFYKATRIISLVICVFISIEGIRSLVEFSDAPIKFDTSYISLAGCLGFIVSFSIKKIMKHITIIISISIIVIEQLFRVFLFLSDFYCFSDACVDYEGLAFPWTLLNDFALIGFLSMNFFSSAHALQRSARLQ